MSEPVAKKRLSGWLKAGLFAFLGVGSGVAATYTNAIVDRVAKPAKPIANFATTTEGLTLTCQNHATGESGWWDFGDGSPLEPFDADQSTVSHQYPKPGTFAVKLTVRNFLSEENQRTVAVELAAAAKDSPEPPQVLGLAVQPVSAVSVAPATFRITAEVKNANHCVWDFGDDRLEVADGGGKIDRLVTFERAGSFPVLLVAHNGKAAAKQAASVKVEAPKDGTLMAVLKVTDTGTRVERAVRTDTITVPAPKEKASPAFAKTVNARPGYTLADAVPTNPNPPGVKGLKVAVAADRKSAAVTGEWAGGDPKGKGGAADAIIPLRLTEEGATALQGPSETITGVFVQAATGQTLVALPLPAAPRNATGVQRKMSLELRQTTGGGQFRTLAHVADLKLPSTVGTINFGPAAGVHTIRANQDGDLVKVVIGY